MINKKLKVTIIVVVLFLTVILSWFAFDLNSKIDVLKHPEKYSFRTNFASFIMQNDYYLAKYPDEMDTFFNELKTIEKKYENKTDDASHKIYQLNNQALDLYHDLLSLHIPTVSISNDDFIFLNQNCKTLADFFYFYLLTYPKLEEKNVLFNELSMRKEAITIIKEDLKDRKINAIVTLNDLKYENLTPAYLSNTEPAFVKEFEKEFERGRNSINKDIDKDFRNALNNAKNKDEALKVKLDYANKIHSKYIVLLDNFNIKWKHRYVISAIEYKNNKEDKITHLYEIYPYKEGNRIYWNIQYHSPNSEFIKAYLKMLELLVNI